MVTIKSIAVITACMVVITSVLSIKGNLPFEEWSDERRAVTACMSVEDFIFISSVVEAESNRCTDSTEGRQYIALVILNRVNDERFPDTISGVLNQSGQFSTVRNGQSVTGRTDLSDLAVIEAVEWLETGEAPTDLLFFNCRGYNYGTPYPNPNGGDTIGGNYFMRLEA